jgi:hypothetical protein
MYRADQTGNWKLESASARLDAMNIRATRDTNPAHEGLCKLCESMTTDTSRVIVLDCLPVRSDRLLAKGGIWVHMVC